MPHVDGIADDGSAYGVKGQNSNAPTPGKFQRVGQHTLLAGVWGDAASGSGVLGTSSSSDGVGVIGTNTTGAAVTGLSKPTIGGIGVTVYQRSAFLAGAETMWGQDVGAYEESGTNGVMGRSTTAGGTGVYGAGTKEGQDCIGVRGETFNGTGIVGRAFGPNGTAAHFFGNVTVSGQFVGDHWFKGNVNVTGEIGLVGADCAEHFDISEQTCADPGTVLVIHGENELRESCDPYDRRVAGVVSGAVKYGPAIILDQRAVSDRQHAAVALIGKVFCKVDATYGSIEVADLLSTSATPGHAMKATDAMPAARFRPREGTSTDQAWSGPHSYPGCASIVRRHLFHGATSARVLIRRR